MSQGVNENSRLNKQTAWSAIDQVALGFSFKSDWLREWREFLEQSRNEVKQNQSNPGLFWTLNWKLLSQKQSLGSKAYLYFPQFLSKNSTRNEILGYAEILPLRLSKKIVTHLRGQPS